MATRKDIRWWVRRWRRWPWAFAFVALAGCATTPPKVVKVPVYSCPTVVIPPKPSMPITADTLSTPPSQVMRDLVESFAKMTGDDSQLRTLLAPYGHH